VTGLFDRTGSVRALAVLRLVLGLVTVVHLATFLRDARDGIYYDDHFWEPYWSGLPKIPGTLWALLLWVGVVSAVLMACGILTRLTSWVTFGVVAGNLLLSQTHFRHNRTFLMILLFGLALLPTGRVLSVDAWWRRVRGRPALTDEALLWPLYLLRTQVSLVYLASGISKLVDPDWLGGIVLWDRVVRYQHHLEPTPLPDWGIDFLTWRPLYLLVAPAAIAIELFVGLGLWSPRTRLAALWLGVVFHLSIEVSASVEVFSLAAIAALAIWVTPSTYDRVLRVPAGSSAAVVVRALDWFGRFRIEDGGPGPTVVDRDGSVLEGREAIGLVATRLPLTFPIAAPVVAIGALRRRRPSGTVPVAATVRTP
jgi:uncharacterized membrane protein YphA (DoxX/SURF4 family)